MSSSIAIFTTGQGHLSIADGIQSLLNKREIKNQKYFFQGKELAIYSLFYRHLPGKFKYVYQLGEAPLARKGVQTYSIATFKKRLWMELESIDPQVLVSCWFTFNPVLKKWAQTHQIPLINIITDPRSIHPLQIEPEAINVVYDDKTRKTLLEMGIQPSQIVTAGWFVRPEYTYNPEIHSLRSKLGLRPDLTTLLLTTGSEGSNRALKFLRILLEILPENTQLQIITGKNKLLQQQCAQLSSSNNRIHVAGFVTNLHEYMQAADLVIGKAGPNSLFESIKTHTPFMATHHIHGQEDGNLDLIEELQVGYVCEQEQLFRDQISEILAQPAQLQKFSLQLKRATEYIDSENKRFTDYLQNLI